MNPIALLHVGRYIVAGSLLAASALCNAQVRTDIAQVPMTAATQATPNLLVMLGNSNSMDSDAAGGAVGSASPESKSEVARNAVKSLLDAFANKINVGLAAYQQSPASLQWLAASPYDLSYDPADYDPSYSGPRDGSKKRFRARNPVDPNSHIYYNVNLPFYSNTDPGNLFCYSAQAGLTLPNYVPNQYNSHYVCWSSKTGRNNDIPANTTTCTSPPPLGYGGVCRRYSFGPTDQDLGQGITHFGRLMASWTTARAWGSMSSPGRGYLHVPIAPLDNTQKALLMNKLATSNPATDTNSPTDPNRPLQNTGLTPLQGTVQTIRDYFRGQLSEAEGGPKAKPGATSCTRNYALLLTDGLPSVTPDGRPSADTAALLAGLTEEVAALKADQQAKGTAKGGANTYVVGFALPFGVNPEQLDAIAQAGGTGTGYQANDPASLTKALSEILTSIANQNGSASSAAVSGAFADRGSVRYQASFNSRDWSGDLKATIIGGELAGHQLWSAQNQLSGQTNRAVLLYGGIKNGKPVNTCSGVSDCRGRVLNLTQSKEENWALLTATEQAQLQVGAASAGFPAGTTAEEVGMYRLQWLLGDTRQEKRNGGPLRNRPQGVLGDIANSSPVYYSPKGNPKESAALGRANIGIAPLPYVALEDDPMSYILSRSTGTWNDFNRVYVGANDGMLHMFCAADDGSHSACRAKLGATTDTDWYGHGLRDALDDAKIKVSRTPGEEIMAYIPPAVFPNLYQLTQPDYQHQPFVDGPMVLGEARLGTLQPFSGNNYTISRSHANWARVLVGSLGAGGQGLFALSAGSSNYLSISGNTQPGHHPTFSDGAVLWNYPSTDATEVPADLGFVMGKPLITRLKAGWVAIFGNGYNSDSGKVALFVLDLKTGALLRSLVVDDVTKDDAPKDDAPKNGLAAPATLDHDRDGYADYVYAGDLTGRLFRFDLRATNPDDWSVDFGGKPMFDAGPTQPITSAPVITPVDINGVATVAFGTGRFLGAVDRTDQNQQALYGVRDAWVGKAGGPSIPITPSQLTEQKVFTQTDLNGRTVLTVSNEPLLDTSLGWRLPLESLGAGARVVATPILRGNTLVLMVIIPSTDDCASGGSSVMLALNALTGGRQPFVAIDGNGDGILDEKDYLNSVVISGVSFDGIASLGGIQNNPGGTSTIQISSSENGGIGKDSQWTLDNSGEPRLGRLSWELLE